MIEGIRRATSPCFYIEQQWSPDDRETVWSEYEEMEGGSSHHSTSESAEKRAAELVAARLEDEPDNPLTLRVAQYDAACATVTCPSCDTTFDTEGEGYTVHWIDTDESIVSTMESMEWRLHDDRLLCNSEDCRCSIEGHVWRDTRYPVEGSKQCSTCWKPLLPEKVADTVVGVGD